VIPAATGRIRRVVSKLALDAADQRRACLSRPRHRSVAASDAMLLTISIAASTIESPRRKYIV
jgi:hypothetical protein